MNDREQVRRVAIKLAQQRIQPARIKRAKLKQTMQM